MEEVSGVDHILLTGGAGFLGKVVLENLIRRYSCSSKVKIYVLIRSKKGRSAENRFAGIKTSPCFEMLPYRWYDSVEVVEGDLSEPRLGLRKVELDSLRKKITRIIHCAASIDFNLPIKEALRDNVDNTLNVLDFAKTCTNLAKMVSVSTAYVNPVPEEKSSETLVPLSRPANLLYQQIKGGLIEEKQLLKESGHPNTYT